MYCIIIDVTSASNTSTASFYLFAIGINYQLALIAQLILDVTAIDVSQCDMFMVPAHCGEF